MANTLKFKKMHGLGNDFVILDERAQKIALAPEMIEKLANRRTGIGFDQLILLRPSQNADIFMDIYNADGSHVKTCGNATRCVAHLMAAEKSARDVTIESPATILECKILENGWVEVDMGRVSFDWRDIPLAEPADTTSLDIRIGNLQNPVAINTGNPHMVFFVEDVMAVDIEKFGPKLEHHPLYPERANVGFAQILDRGTIRQRVWERGAGVTSACGSSACATGVAAFHRGLTERRVKMILDGGELIIEYLPDDHVMMAGPVSIAFDGEVDLQNFS